jgi:hypothetical protein
MLTQTKLHFISLTLLLLLSSAPSSYQFTFDSKTNIIVLLFPDGSNSSSTQLLPLLKHAYSKNSDLYFHIVLHLTDFPFWRPSSNQHFIFYPFGTITTLPPFNKLEGNSFNKDVYFPRMKEFHSEFFKNNLSGALNAKGVKFDLIITDSPNYPSIYLQNIFNIKNIMYLTHRPFPQVFFRNFNNNSNYFSYINTPKGKSTTLQNKVMDYFTYLKEKFFYIYYQNKGHAIVDKYQIKDIPKEMHVNNSVTLMQYVEGFGSPLQQPANMFLLNAFDIHDESKNVATYEIPKNKRHNIYVSKELYFKYKSEFDKRPLFNYYYDIEYLYNEVNVKNKKISCSITTNDYNEIMHSLYNGIPVITIKGKGFVEKYIQDYITLNQLGENVDTFDMNMISMILTDDKLNEYTKNAEQIRKGMLNGNDAKERFAHWLSHGLSHGYSDVMVNVNESGKAFVDNNVDLICGFVLLPLVLFVIAYIIFKKIVNCLCGKKERKEKVKKD